MPAGDFILVIDTREKEPYSFACAVTSMKLAAGDYSVAGREMEVAVERKSLRDFTTTVIHDTARFARELLLLSTYDAACVVVEADLDAVLRGLRQDDLRGVSPATLLGSALHISLRYRVPVHWCGSRQAACAFTEGFLRMHCRLHPLPREKA